MDTTSLQPQISTHHTHLDPPNPYAPAFIFHLTRLTSTLFVWVGTAASASGPEGSGGFGAGGNGGGGGIGMEEDGAQGLGGERKLAADWGVAMPSRGVSLAEILMFTKHTLICRICQWSLRLCSGLERWISQFQWLNA